MPTITGLVLAAGGEPFKVIGEAGEVLGLATLDAIGGVLKDANDGGAGRLPESGPAHPAAQENA